MRKQLLIYFCFLLVTFYGYSQMPTETFEAGIPSTWLTKSDGSTLLWGTSTDGYMSNGSAFIDPRTDNIGAGNTAKYYLISPLVTIPANGEVRFFTKQSDEADNGSRYEIRLSTANREDLGGYTTLLTAWTETQLNPTTPLGYVEKIVTLPPDIAPGVEVYIAFVLENKQIGATPMADTWFVDNVRVMESCIKVDEANVTFEDITIAEATVNWTHPDVTNFDIQIFDHDQNILVASDSVNGNEYTFEELTGATSYDVYIKTICDPLTATEWAGPFNFSTAMLGLGCDSPILITGNSYTYNGNVADFIGNLGGYGTHGSNCLPPAVTANYLQGNKAFFSYTPTQDGFIDLSQMTYDYWGGMDAGLSNCWGNSQSAVLVYEDCSKVGIECIAGLYTSATMQPSMVKNLQVVAGKTYLIVISTIFDDPEASVCFTFKVNFTTCPAPSQISYNNLLRESGDFSWNNAGSAAQSWQYIVLPAGSPAPALTEQGTATLINTDVHIDELTEGTKYDIYVRSVCGGVPGEWGAPFTFMTQCGTFQLPFYTGFEAAAMGEPEPCWTALDLNNDNVTWNYLGGWDVAGYATIMTETNQNNNRDYLVTPEINFPEGSIFKKLRFKHQITAWNDVNNCSYSIKLSTTGLGENNFTYVIRPTTSISNTEWQEVTYDIPASITGNVHIAWIIEPTSGGEQPHNSFRLNITDIYIYEHCDAPSAPEMGTITENTAVLTWTPAALTDTAWEVLVQPRGSAVPLMNTPGTLVDTSNYLTEDLIRASQYEYYVRTSCSATAKSEWIGPVYFTTLCGVLDEPYLETFNTTDSEINNPKTKRYCWEILNQNEDTYAWNFTATAASTNVRTTGSDEWLISPAINLDDATGGYHELKFKHKKTGGGSNTYSFEVLISYTDKDPASFTPLIEYQNYGSSTSYQNVLKYFEGTGTVYIAFRVPPQFVPTQNFSVQIDDFSLKAVASCVVPTNLVRDTTTNILSWNAGANETQWEVVLVTADVFVPTNGTIVDTPSYEALGLEPGIAYKFFVRAICGGNDISAWVGPLQFTMPCTQVFNTPFIETFETDSQSLNCWTPNAWITNNALNPYAGNYSAGIYTYFAVPNQHWLISPTITITENQRLRFYYKGSQWLGFEEDLKVWLSTAGPAIAGFTNLLFDTGNNRILNNEVYKEIIINLPPGITGDVNIGFQVPAKVAGQFYDRQNLFIDNVIIEDIPTCPSPYNIGVLNIVDTSFQLNWDSAGTETEWEVLAVPYKTENPFENINPDNIHVVTSNPGTISGLLPATAYQVYIRPVCSETLKGEWSELIEVVTKCSFEDLCEYTITLHGGDTNTMGIAGGIDVIQNGVVVQTLEFPSGGAWFETMVPIDYLVFLCSGVEFTLHWDSLGWAPNQYPDAYVKVTNAAGEEVWMSELGIGLPKSDIYKSIAICNPISCPQPKDLTVGETGELSWSAAGSETQWEVYVQPYQLGALPQSGTLVTSTSYTPQSDDFIEPNLNVYEYFVRAICEDGSSYWSGPTAFVRNDSPSKSTTAPVNPDENCTVALERLSFLGSTPSSETMTCQIPHNGGDVWVEFTPTSTTHSIELGGFSGSHYDAGYAQLPKIVMTLYKVNADNTLQEIACSDNNVMYTMYSSEVVVGEKYKIRLTNTNDKPNAYTFDMCITTITNTCRVNTPNYSFESPRLVTAMLVDNMLFDNVIPGWRTSMEYNNAMFIWNAENDFSNAYHGGQFLQLSTDYNGSGNPEDLLNDPNDFINIRGEYQDFDTSEITQFDYSFAHRRRIPPMFDTPGTRVVQLYAGPIGGPYTLVKEEATIDAAWTTAVGKYNVPAGQTKTRFIFRTKNNFGMIILDAANFIPFNEILTAPHSIDCGNPETELRAEGLGKWIAAENNPAPVIFANENSKTTTVSGFNTPGEYTFYWKTRYCEDSVTVTYEGFEEVPTVTSPVEYCINTTAVPLEATAMAGYTLKWFTEQVGGTGSTSIPTPDTTVAETKMYYVSHVDTNGCEGPRVPITVTINALIEPVVGFTYDATEYCSAEMNAVITLNADFVTGGTFTATPNGLSINATTGAIDLTQSTAGDYDITYNLDAFDCTDSGTTTVSITIIESVTPITDFSYSAVSYCTDATNPLPVLATDFYTGGTFTSTTGLSINATTGEIDLANSTAGTYDVTYTVNAGQCISEESTTVSVTVTAVTTAVVNFSYTETTVCIDSESDLTPIKANNFSEGGEFTSTTLTVNPLTGVIDMSTATAGNHDVVYTIDSDPDTCFVGGIFTVSIELLDQVTPVTSFSYAASYCIGSANPLPVLATDFYVGGTFTSATGLSINATTGEIDLANSTAGTYNVTYAVAAGQCISVESTVVSVTITAETTAVVNFSYEGPVCIDSDTELVPIMATGFTFGGTFTSSTVTVDPETGIIDLASATAGNHEVIYTIDSDADICFNGGTFTTSIVLVNEIVPVTEFTYEDSYCGEGTALPALGVGFTQGGIFTASGNLVINATTGEINIGNNESGTYVITYTIEPDMATCNIGGTHEYTISIGGDLATVVTEDCINQLLWLHAETANGLQEAVSYVWKNENGVVVGSDNADFNVSEYFAANPNLELPLMFTVTVSSGACSFEADYMVDSILCMVPRGISPNGDGNNDRFDLSDMGVKELTIFNRYGKDVYHFKGTYTDQWFGQERNGNELPTGTYFYTIFKTDGSTTTGWVYINRQ